MNVSRNPKSVKAAASASTPRAATPVSAHPAWSSTWRTRDCAQVEALGRQCEDGLELEEESRRFLEPEEEGEEPQVPAMPRACRGPAQGFASPKGPTTGQGGGRAFWAWGSLVEFPAPVNIPQTSPLPHLSHSSRGSCHFLFPEGEPQSRAGLPNPMTQSPSWFYRL